MNKSPKTKRAAIIQASARQKNSIMQAARGQEKFDGDKRGPQKDKWEITGPPERIQQNTVDQRATEDVPDVTKCAVVLEVQIVAGADLPPDLSSTTTAG